MQTAINRIACGLRKHHTRMQIWQFFPVAIAKLSGITRIPNHMWYQKGRELHGIYKYACQKISTVIATCMRMGWIYTQFWVESWITRHIGLLIEQTASVLYQLFYKASRKVQLILVQLLSFSISELAPVFLQFIRDIITASLRSMKHSETNYFVSIWILIKATVLKWIRTNSSSIELFATFRLIHLIKRYHIQEWL